MKREQTCCVTGHRDIALEKVPFVNAKLHVEIQKAISNGYTHFISGFATVTDLIFANIVAELRHNYLITLEAAIPCPSRLNTVDVEFQRLIKVCDVVNIVSNRYYGGCYKARNYYMVDSSSLVIAVYDGRKRGGTVETMRYAKKKGCALKEIAI